MGTARALVKPPQKRTPTRRCPPMKKLAFVINYVPAPPGHSWRDVYHALKPIADREAEKLQRLIRIEQAPDLPDLPCT